MKKFSQIITNTHWRFPLLLCMVVVAFHPIEPCAQTDNLPAESKRLLRLLKEFEAREQKKFDHIVGEKRKKVIDALKSQLKATTRDGNLASALLIQEEIKKLEKLVRVAIPETLSPVDISFEKNRKEFKPATQPPRYSIDGDQEKGTMILKFKHDQMPKLLNGDHKIELSLQISDIKTSGSDDGAVVKWGNVVVGSKKKFADGEAIKIEIEAWKIRGNSKELELTLSCSSGDGYSVELEGNAPVLLLSQSK